MVLNSSPVITISGIDLPTTGALRVRLADRNITARVFNATITNFGNRINGVSSTQWQLV